MEQDRIEMEKKKAKDELAQKNDELLAIMQNIESNKGEGWGGENKKEKTGEEFEDLQSNLNKAIK